MRIGLRKKIVTDGNKVEEIVTGKSLNANTVLDPVILEVESTGGIAIKGAMDSETLSEISAVSMKTFEAVNSISEAGLYTIPASGLNKLVLEITGATVVNVRGLYE